jgi:hypothetical protein
MDKKDRLKQANDERHKALKSVAPDLWRRCVESASGIAMTHDLDFAAAASVENALVAMALEGMAEGLTEGDVD